MFMFFTSKFFQVLIFSKNQSEEEIDELHSNYSKWSFFLLVCLDFQCACTWSLWLTQRTQRIRSDRNHRFDKAHQPHSMSSLSTLQTAFLQQKQAVLWKPISINMWCFQFVFNTHILPVDNSKTKCNPVREILRLIVNTDKWWQDWRRTLWIQKVTFTSDRWGVVRPSRGFTASYFQGSYALICANLPVRQSPTLTALGEKYTQ